MARGQAREYVQALCKPRNRLSPPLKLMPPRRCPPITGQPSEDVRVSHARFEGVTSYHGAQSITINISKHKPCAKPSKVTPRTHKTLVYGVFVVQCCVDVMRDTRKNTNGVIVVNQ